MRSDSDSGTSHPHPVGHIVRTDDGLIVKRAGKNRAGNWQLVSDHPNTQDWPTRPWADTAEGLGEVT